jgi:hypothetical protein
MLTTMIPINKYIEDFDARCEELSNTKLEDAPKVEVIINQVNEMIEEYFKYVGSMPKPKSLERLANYILVNELKSKDVDKVANTDFPILSDIQLKRRARKQMVMQDSTLDFLNTKYNKQIDSLSRASIKKVEY